MKKDRDTVKTIQSKLLEFSKGLAEEFDLKFQKCNASFNEFELNFKIVFHSTNNKGMDVYQDAYLKYAEIYGLKKEWLGDEIKAGRLLLTVKGLDRKKKKYPIILEDAVGNQYKMTIPDFLGYIEENRDIKEEQNVER